MLGHPLVTCPRKFSLVSDIWRRADPWLADNVARIAARPYSLLYPLRPRSDVSCRSGDDDHASPFLTAPPTGVRPAAHRT